MEPGQISGLHGEVSGLPVPLSASVTEQQLPELRVYTVATGEQEVGQQSLLNPRKHVHFTSPKHHFSVLEGDTVISICK